MKASVKNENHIFLFAFLGSLLFVAAIGFLIANFTNLSAQTFTVPGATVNGCMSFIFLYLAVKKDKNRPRTSKF